MKKRTIFESIVLVLDEVPQSAREIHARIVKDALFVFKAKDPVAIVRATIRAHLKSHGGPGQPQACVRAVEPDRYVRN